MDGDFRQPARRVRTERPLRQTVPEVDTPASVTSEPFKTPEQIAASDQTTSDTEPLQTAVGADIPSNPFKKNRRFKRIHWPATKKGWVIFAVSCLVLLGIIGSVAMLILSSPKKVVSIKKALPTSSHVVPAVTTVASDLSGLPVDPSANQRPVTAVMIENSLDARPQSGLSQAGVVFEAVAEGGITRFMALYQDQEPNNVGPIRSARPYYMQWALGFDAGYAHVGGSPDALSEMGPWNVRDLDEFYNGNYYHRITSRQAPHNVYTSLNDLLSLEAAKGYTSSTFTSWPRKTDDPAKQPTAQTISILLSSSDYNVSYAYDPSTDSYLRSEGGAPQIDANTNAQLNPKVVIAIVTPETQGALDASGAYYSDYNVLGTGTAYIFQDGLVTVGEWSKASNTAQILFTTNAGKSIAFNAGQVWITAITASGNVSYVP